MAFYLHNAGQLYYNRKVESFHLVADSMEELLTIGDKIGLKRSWLQEPVGQLPHYDVFGIMVDRAKKVGAISIDNHAIAELKKKWEEKGRFLLASVKIK